MEIVRIFAHRALLPTLVWSVPSATGPRLNGLDGGPEAPGSLDRSGTRLVVMQSDRGRKRRR
jgi:hypothetical protein